VISALLSNQADKKLPGILFFSIVKVKIFAARKFLKSKIVLDYTECLQ